jgi:ClpP class serine protease
MHSFFTEEPFLLDVSFFEAMTTQDIESSAFLFFLGGEPENILSIEGNTATVTIQGVLQDDSSVLSFFDAGTTYSQIADALIEAEGTQGIEQIDLLVDSPGGSVDGVERVARLVAQSEKKTHAIVSNKALSAAYWIASQADEIVATSRTTRFGSIGVVYESIDRSGQNGVQVIQITNRQSPLKIIDPKTDEGQSRIQDVLDKIFAVFLDSVAQGRKTDEEKVVSSFGQGGVLLAEDALQVGMIDTLNVNVSPGQSASDDSINSMEVLTMNLEELKAQHPDLYTQILQKGIDSERQRVTRLINWDTNEATRAVVREAISTGKNQDDCLAQLTAASNMSAEAAGMEAENVDDISTAAASAAASEDVKDEDVKALVEEARKHMV